MKIKEAIIKHNDIAFTCIDVNIASGQDEVFLNDALYNLQLAEWLMELYELKFPSAEIDTRGIYDD